MSRSGLRQIKRAATRLWNKHHWGGLILLYHRVAQTNCDPWSLCVSPEHFREHLEVLKKLGLVTELRKLAQDSASKGFTRQRSIAVTFDDGYADILHNALPLLERYEIPATVFFTSKSIQACSSFWWDQLERVFLRPGLLPQELCLCVRGRSVRIELGDDSELSEGTSRDYGKWRAMHDPPPTGRHRAFCMLYDTCRTLLPADRDEMIASLNAQLNSGSSTDKLQRPMALAELVELKTSRFIEIGAHTVNHPFLSNLPQPYQRREVALNKGDLEKVLGRKITSFAYPHGDFSPNTLNVIRSSGFDCACSTRQSLVRGGSDLFALPRFTVEDWSGSEFEQRLSNWLQN